MDFFQFRIKKNEKTGVSELFPGFLVGRSKDLMVRGGKFYAIWDETEGLWSQDEYAPARLVDQALYAYSDEQAAKGNPLQVKSMRSFDSASWSTYQKFINQVGDNSQQLDQNLTFANTEVKKSDYVSRRLPYSLATGDHSAWDELVGTLYSVEERAKIEWAIGAIVSGDSKRIQKFLVLYGPAGTGKSTILNIVEKLFEGYTTTFEAKALGGNNNQFATEVFKGSPLVAIQHDGDLSRIEDNTKLNSIISHEEMTMNEKFKSSYTGRINAFLLMGTNNPVKISDSKSGIIRRLIDVHPTGVHIPPNHYQALITKIDFELGAIAQHCLNVYRDKGKNYYNGYRPLEMMLQTDVFFNFIESYYHIFQEQDGASLTQAYLFYKEYCADSGIERMLPKYKFREELRNYFDEFKERAEVDGHTVRSYYSGFNAAKFKMPSKDGPTDILVMDETESLLDDLFANQPAQGATSRETPKKKWLDVTTVLGDMDTSELHFVRVPENHIVIDFDLVGEDGQKSLERNLEAASVWPATYAEFSKGGAGVHLHYDYDGDVTMLGSQYSEGIEVKTLLGDASLRRRLSKCNNIPVATISTGLPIKEKKVLDAKTIQSEKGLRDMIARNLQKQIHPGTKSSVDFIKKILDEAQASDLVFDVTDLKPHILSFALNSTNQSINSVRVVQEMKFRSDNTFGEDPVPTKDDQYATPEEKAVALGFQKEQRLAFFDVEVYPNLFVICWKYQGDATIVRMINPTPQEVERLFALKLVGFNNRRYDNHIIYARSLGYDNEQLYKLSQKIIDNDHSALFGAAYNISYADIYEFSSKKQGLKKFGIELGMAHVEMDIPWDQPVPEELVPKVVDYCCNDVELTEATFEARKQDFIARKILADLSQLSINDTTQKHTARIIFGKDRYPQSKFKKPNLAEEFPGYLYDFGKSSYKGENPSEGGYVYAEPGMYENVAVLDIASMHPTTIGVLNLFGEYTKNFLDLKDARMAIKHKDYDKARKMLGGKLAPHLEDPADADALSYALKIVINIVYGMTSAKFDNPFRDIRNKDNVVAKRGALFMIDLKNYVQDELKTQVVHIKTDSIKIANATPEQIQAITEFGKKYGYDFEHETTYDRFCLVNDAVYIARKGDKWDATGAQFAHPYVYKTLFSGEEITFDDLCETKQVTQGSMYLDFEHDTPPKSGKDGLKFVGRTGRFTPVEEGQDGAILYRIKEDKHYAVTGTKGHLWLESEMALSQNAKVDMSYFENLVANAETTIGKFCDVDWFVS